MWSTTATATSPVWGAADWLITCTVPSENQGDRFLIHSDEEYLVVKRKICIFALYNVNKHSMLRQKREKNGTGICHVMQGKESKTCPYDSS